MRMMVVFEKGFALRHIGHLDLMCTIQRALRRSDLPIKYSNGFNPHIQLSFAAPLSVGVVGMREIMDVPMAEEVDPQTMVTQLNRVLPPALRVYTARSIPDNFPTLMALVAGSNIRIEIDACEAADLVVAAFQPFMESKECITLRKTKSGANMTNIRPFLLQGSIEPKVDGYTLRCVIANQREGSLKPAVLMRGLCELADVDNVPYIAYRDTILAKGGDKTLIALEEYVYA